MEGAAAGCTAAEDVDCVGAGAGCEAEASPLLLGVVSGSAAGSEAAASSAGAGAAAGGCSTSMVLFVRVCIRA